MPEVSRVDKGSCMTRLRPKEAKQVNKTKHFLKLYALYILLDMFESTILTVLFIYGHTMRLPAGA